MFGEHWTQHDVTWRCMHALGEMLSKHEQASQGHTLSQGFEGHVFLADEHVLMSFFLGFLVGFFFSFLSQYVSIV